MARLGDFFHTASKVEFYPLDPRPEDVKLEDVSISLAHQRRWLGHTQRMPISIAQHSWNVGQIAKEIIEIQDRPWSVAAELLGYVHDAAEAYTGDIPRPLKKMLWVKGPHGLESIYEVEKRIWVAIMEAWKIDRFLASTINEPGLTPIEEAVRIADDLMLLAEARYCCGRTDEDFEGVNLGEIMEARSWWWDRLEMNFAQRVTTLYLRPGLKWSDEQSRVVWKAALSQCARDLGVWDKNFNP